MENPTTANVPAPIVTKTEHQTMAEVAQPEPDLCAKNNVFKDRWIVVSYDYIIFFFYNARCTK